MSADKHKKRDRAFAFIRSLRKGYRGFPRGEAKTRFSGCVSPIMKYCVDRGFAVIRRTRWGEFYDGCGRWPVQQLRGRRHWRGGA
jgi:hypothetical protein